MYETLNQVSYTNMSHFCAQPLPPSIPNHRLPSDPSFSHPPPHFQSLPSDTSFYHPPAFNPYSDPGRYQSNYTCFETPPINYSVTNEVPPSWVVKQAAPIKYSPAIQPLRKEAIASTSNDAPLNYNLVSRKSVTTVSKKKLKRPKTIRNKASVNQSLRCELCRIECNNVQVYEKHLSGKKHGKGLLKLYAPALQSAAVKASQSIDTKCTSGERVSPDGQGITGVPTKPANLEVKKQKLLEGGTAAQSLKICTICNVACNGEIAFADHVVGKKHVAKERSRSSVGNSNLVSVSTLEAKVEDNPTKKRKIGEPAPAWCDVCKISCTSSDGLNVHLVGKKHKKNLQKLQLLNTDAITAAAPLPIKNPSNGVEENIIDARPTLSESQQAKKKGQSKDPKDVETKKRIILECGAAADALRMCAICNVVCNSVTVFNSHLAGQKHAAMLKQAEVASSGLQVAYPAT